VVTAQFPDGGFVPMTGPLANSGQEIDPVTPVSVINVILWAVSQSLDSFGTLQTNPIVPGITPSCTVSYGTTGYTIPPVQNTPPLTGMAIAVSIIDGPAIPSGVPMYGWTGTLTLPSDKTFYSGCDLSRQLPPDGECFYNSLGPNDTAFSNGYYPRPKVDTPNGVFRAYPKNKDGVRGAPVSVTVTVAKGGANTTNMGSANPTTLGTGLQLDPITGLPRWATGNPSSSLLLDWDFSLSKLGPITAGVTSPWGYGGTAVIQNDADVNGNYCRLTGVGSNVQQPFVIAPGCTLTFYMSVRGSVSGGSMAAYFYFYDGAGAQIGSPVTLAAGFGGAGVWAGGVGSMGIAGYITPANAVKGLVQIIVLTGGPYDVGKIVLHP
jgi:hypothetical protein